MARMTGGQALVGQLRRDGIEVVFGLPGVQLYGALAALRDEPGIRFVQTRHEQATSFMADGYARAGGRIGTALVVPGPGLLNAASGLSTAYAASSPVLMLVGQVPRAQIGRDIGVLHEVNDQLDCVRPITKWRRRILDVGSVPPAVRAAVRQLTSGRPRPVALDLPPDVLEEEGDAELLEPEAPAQEAAPARDVERAAAALLAAARPVIYAGGGVNLGGAHEALASVAEYLQAAVVMSPEGKGAVSDESELSLGATIWPASPVRRWFVECDVVLAVGTRLALAAPRPEQLVVQLDVDADEVGRNHRRTLGLVGDARLTLERLLEALRAAAPPRPSRKAEREALRAESAAAGHDPQGSILASLRRGTPEDAIFVAGMTQIGYYSRAFWPVYGPRTYLTSSYSGNLGYEYPLALGAKVARPERAVVVTAGDGGFLYNAQELATAAQHGIAVVAVVFNDQSYGNVARDLDEGWGGQYGAELRNPDFMKLADAYGVRGERVADPTDVGRAVTRALELDAPALIEVPVGRMPRPVVFPPRPAPRRT